MSESIDLGAGYRAAREAVAELVRTLGPAQLQASVPACPGWSVHDVVSHLTGVATDVVNGQARGAPDDERSTAHVAERAGTPTSIVLREWERSASQFEAVLSKSHSSDLAPVFDIAVHEHDIRGALGLPGNRDGELIDLAVGHTTQLWLSKIESAGLDTVVIVDDVGSVIAGGADAPVTFRASRFEFFRAAFGRRSPAQIERRFNGADDPSPYVPLLCLLGPAKADIIE